MKEKLKELLSVPTKTWEEDRLIDYLIEHLMLQRSITLEGVVKPLPS